MRGVRIDPERTEVRRILRGAPVRGARLLEIGCGNGRLTRRLAGVFASVVGVDPSAEEIARARRLIPQQYRRRMHFELGQGERLRFRDRRFDLVLFSWSL